MEEANTNPISQPQLPYKKIAIRYSSLRKPGESQNQRHKQNRAAGKQKSRKNIVNIFAKPRVDGRGVI